MPIFGCSFEVEINNTMRLSILFILLNFNLLTRLKAQSLMNCKADLEWTSGREGEKQTNALLVLDKASNELKGDIGLSPFVSDPDLRDSLQNLQPPFHLTFSGLFPLNQPEFFSAADNEKQVTMQARITIGDSTLIQNMSLILTMLRDKRNDVPSGTESYVLPCRANFVLSVDPKSFGLNRSPLRWNRKFTIEVENGVINRK